MAAVHLHHSDFWPLLIFTILCSDRCTSSPFWVLTVVHLQPFWVLTVVHLHHSDFWLLFIFSRTLWVLTSPGDPPSPVVMPSRPWGPSSSAPAPSSTWPSTPYAPSSSPTPSATSDSEAPITAFRPGTLAISPDCRLAPPIRPFDCLSACRSVPGLCAYPAIWLA